MALYFIIQQSFTSVLDIKNNSEKQADELDNTMSKLEETITTPFTIDDMPSPKMKQQSDASGREKQYKSISVNNTDIALVNSNITNLNMSAACPSQPGTII